MPGSDDIDMDLSTAVAGIGGIDDGVAARAAALLRRAFPKGRIERVLLVNPPDADDTLFQYDTARRGRYTNYPPYGLAVLATALRDAGVDVRICNLNHAVLTACRSSAGPDDFDFNAVWQSTLDRAIAAFRPDLIGLTCMFTMTHASLRNVCARAAASGAPLAIGGVHVSNDVERILDDLPDVSFAFLREGEVAFRTLVQVVAGHAGVGDLGQVIMVDGDARLRFHRPLQPAVEDINIIPAYDLCDVERLSEVGTIGAFYCFKPAGTRFATVLSNRGCRAQCTFCSVRNFNGKSVRQRAVDSVLDELQLLHEVYGVGHVMWLDDDLLKDHARAIALFNGIVRRGLDLTWDATNGVIAASCTDEVIAAAADSGCIAINIGMESGNPGILRQVRKPGTVRNFLAAAEVLRRYERIHASVFLMVGFPGETMAMIQDTINVAREMDLDWYRVSQLQPLPNTPIYDAMVAQGLIAPVGSRELRFMGGAYGKQAEIEQGKRMATADFEDAFAGIPLDAVPTPDQLTDVWFYTNYHLNFHRLFTEARATKIDQLLRHLHVLCDVISPENGFALYFIGYLQHKHHGRIEPEIIARLAQRLDTSPFWRDRFSAFGLSLDDLKNVDFRNKHIPRLLPGKLPSSAAA